MPIVVWPGKPLTNASHISATMSSLRSLRTGTSAETSKALSFQTSSLGLSPENPAQLRMRSEVAKAGAEMSVSGTKCNLGDEPQSGSL